MKVILKADIKGVGKKNQVIDASDGYARNFLFPKKLAVEANNENMNKLKAKKQSEQYKKDVEKENAQKIADGGNFCGNGPQSGFRRSFYRNRKQNGARSGDAFFNGIKRARLPLNFESVGRKCGGKGSAFLRRKRCLSRILDGN